MAARTSPDAPTAPAGGTGPGGRGEWVVVRSERAPTTGGENGGCRPRSSRCFRAPTSTRSRTSSPRWASPSRTSRPGPTRSSRWKVTGVPSSTTDSMDTSPNSHTAPAECWSPTPRRFIALRLGIAANQDAVTITNVSRHTIPWADLEDITLINLGGGSTWAARDPPSGIRNGRHRMLGRSPCVMRSELHDALPVGDAGTHARVVRTVTPTSVTSGHGAWGEHHCPGRGLRLAREEAGSTGTS